MRETLLKNQNYSITILVYGTILGIIYGYWTYREGFPLWFAILVGVGFVFVAFLITVVVYNIKKRKQNKEEAKEETIEENTINE